MLTAAQRLDTAHRQFERIRAGPDSYDQSAPDFESVASIVADAEWAMIALHRAFAMARKKHPSPHPGPPFPESLEDRWDTIQELRHAFEHIDDRALGYAQRGSTVEVTKAHTVFAVGGSLLDHRRIRYRRWSLGIDEPATRLMRALARHIVRRWEALPR